MRQAVILLVPLLALLAIARLPLPALVDAVWGLR